MEKLNIEEYAVFTPADGNLLIVDTEQDIIKIRDRLSKLGIYCWGIYFN